MAHHRAVPQQQSHQGDKGGALSTNSSRHSVLGYNTILSFSVRTVLLPPTAHSCLSIPMLYLCSNVPHCSQHRAPGGEGEGVTVQGMSLITHAGAAWVHGGTQLCQSHAMTFGMVYTIYVTQCTRRGGHTHLQPPQINIQQINTSLTNPTNSTTTSWDSSAII